LICIKASAANVAKLPERRWWDFSVVHDETVDQADEEESLLSYEISDEALEAAAGNEALPTATFICSGFCCQSWAADKRRGLIGCLVVERFC
jgi:hypothetical protein